MSDRIKGGWQAVAAYTLWGLGPVYFKWLGQVPALQVIGHRIIWCFLMLCVVLALTRRWTAFRAAILAPGVMLPALAAAMLIAVNWLIFVWAINAGFIIETSLGYFINPLLSVLLAVIFLHERLRPWQWLPIALAAAGVIYLTYAYGALPWIGLGLAFSFGFYGLIKKTAPLGPLFGLTLETAILLVPALLYLLYADGSGQGVFLHAGALTDDLLIGTGAVTAAPLLLFAAAAQRIPLALLGVLQYIAPTLQFLLGVLIYHEAFSHAQFVGYAIVWAGLLCFWLEGWLAHRIRTAAAGAGI